MLTCREKRQKLSGNNAIRLQPSVHVAQHTHFTGCGKLHLLKRHARAMQHHMCFALCNVRRPNVRFIPRHVRLRPCLPIQLIAVPHGVEHESVRLSNDVLFTRCTMDHNKLAEVLHACHPFTIRRDGNSEARSINRSLRVDTTCTCCTASCFPQPASFRCVHHTRTIGQPLETSATKAACHTWRWLKWPGLFSTAYPRNSAQLTFSLLTCPKHQYIACGAYLRLGQVSGIEATLEGNSRNLHGH